MGEYAEDFYYEDPIDSDYEPDYYPRPVRCNRCRVIDLHWRQVGVWPFRKWKLFNAQGIEHRCLDSLLEVMGDVPRVL